MELRINQITTYVKYGSPCSNNYLTEKTMHVPSEFFIYPEMQFLKNVFHLYWLPIAGQISHSDKLSQKIRAYTCEVQWHVTRKLYENSNITSNVVEKSLT